MYEMIMFLQGMLWCGMAKTWCDICWCMRWSCFVIGSRLACRWVRQPAGAIGLSLIYCMTCVSIIKRHVIALLYRYALAIVIEAMVGETTTWRHDDGDHDDGDHGVMPVTMEIMPVLWRWRSKARDDNGHIMSHIDCMWCLSFYASYFA